MLKESPGGDEKIKKDSHFSVPMRDEIVGSEFFSGFRRTLAKDSRVGRLVLQPTKSKKAKLWELWDPVSEVNYMF